MNHKPKPTTSHILVNKHAIDLSFGGVFDIPQLPQLTSPIESPPGVEIIRPVPLRSFIHSSPQLV